MVKEKEEARKAREWRKALHIHKNKVVAAVGTSHASSPGSKSGDLK